MNAPSRSALLTAFAAIYLVWGSTYLGIRLAVATLPPFLMAGSRFLVAGGLIVVSDYGAIGELIRHRIAPETAG